MKKEMYELAMDFKAADKEYIVNVYNRMDAVLDHGKGSVLYDVNGKEYIDLSAGIAVNVFGVCDDVWKDAVTAQLNKLSHISNVFYTEPQGLLFQLRRRIERMRHQGGPQIFSRQVRRRPLYDHHAEKQLSRPDDGHADGLRPGFAS